MGGLLDGRRDFRQPRPPLVVAVEASPGLAAEQAGFDHRPLQRVRPEARLLVERAVDALAGGEVDVDPDEVEQLEGAHAEPGAAHGGVDAGHGDALRVQPQGLEVEGARQPVHDEAGRVLGDDGLAAEPPHERHGLCHEVSLGAHAGHHLDETHEAGWVEEVQADQSARVRHRGGDRRHRQRRGVRGQPCARRGSGGAREQVAFERQVLRRGLDHPVGAGDAPEVLREVEARQQRSGLGVQAALGSQAGEEVGQGGAGPRERRGRRVEERDRGSGLQEQLRDAAAHGAGAEHGGREPRSAPAVAPAHAPPSRSSMASIC